jgi:nitrate reductase NapAB chaperone NapD
MPIKSYLTYPEPGKLSEAAAELATIPGCEVYPSTTHDVLILVTDTADDAEEAALEAKLSQVAVIHCLALVSGAEPDLIQIEPTAEVRP